MIAPPPSAPAAAPPPARVLVRDALRRLVSGGEWPFASWTVLQNRLLDEVGGDLRPLVALLVRAGESGLVDQLPASRAAWPQVRAALVLSLVDGAFLQQEMARWAVECWAFAVGVATEADLVVAADPRLARRVTPFAPHDTPPDATPRSGAVPFRPEPQSAPPPTSRPATSVAAAPARAAGRSTPPPTGAAPRPTVATAVLAGRASPTPAAPPLVVRYAAVPARRAQPGRLPPGLDNPVAGLSLLGIVGFVGYVLYSAVATPVARADDGALAAGTASAPVAMASSAPAGVGPAGGGAADAVAAAPGIPGVTTYGLPQTSADSARMIRVVPARRPTLSLEQLPPTPAPETVSATSAPSAGGTLGVARPAFAVATPVAAPVAPPVANPPARPAVTATAPADGFDRLRLRDGRVLRGRVELVRVSALVFRDAESGLRYEHPKADVEAIVTEFGSVVRFSPAIAPPAAPGPAERRAERPGGSLVRRGLGGRYRVRYTLVSVTGSAECRRGWDAAPPAAWARVDHAPGADTLGIAFEGGATFASVVDADAQFASTFVIVPDQAYTGSALTTRLNGRFTATGFDAAVNLVGYRRVREGRDVACHTVLRADGERAPGVVPPAR